MAVTVKPAERSHTAPARPAAALPHRPLWVLGPDACPVQAGKTIPKGATHYQYEGDDYWAPIGELNTGDRP
jgi:hypothetical protein